MTSLADRIRALPVIEPDIRSVTRLAPYVMLEADKVEALAGVVAALEDCAPYCEDLEAARAGREALARLRAELDGTDG